MSGETSLQRKKYFLFRRENGRSADFGWIDFCYRVTNELTIERNFYD